MAAADSPQGIHHFHTSDRSQTPPSLPLAHDPGLGLLTTSAAKVNDHQVTMRFMPRDPIFEEEKPYHIRYEPHGDIPARNFAPEVVDMVKVRDIRPVISELELDRDGLVVRKMNLRLSYADYADPNCVIDNYLPDVTKLLQNMLGTKNVVPLEYMVRRRHASFPMALKDEYDYVQPVAGAHIDFSPECIVQILEDRYGSEVDLILNHKYQLITVWKPLRGPVQDWPLSLCLAPSIDEADLELMDLVYANHIEECVSIYYSPKQDWVYLNNQMPDEMLIFKGGDSDAGIKGGLPHCAFQLPGYPADTMPRESIEVRCLVCYADQELDMSRRQASQRRGPNSDFPRKS